MIESNQKHLEILMYQKKNLYLAARCNSRWNYVWLSDAALDDLFFLKNLFYQKQCKYPMNIGVVQVNVTHIICFIGKKGSFISLPDAAFNF